MKQITDVHNTTQCQGFQPCTVAMLVRLLLLVQLPQMRHLNIEDCAHISNLGVQQFKLRVLQAGPVPQGRTSTGPTRAR
jgi:hypothetical protein